MRAFGVLIACALPCARSDVVMPRYFGDGMVLQSNHQSGLRSFLWGWAAPHERVLVKTQDAHKTVDYAVAANAAGSWAVQLNPNGEADFTKGATIIVRSGNGSATHVAKNVLEGDVYLCAGGAPMAARKGIGGSLIWMPPKKKR